MNTEKIRAAVMVTTLMVAVPLAADRSGGGGEPLGPPCGRGESRRLQCRC
jgi:hypothetical protein